MRPHGNEYLIAIIFCPIGDFSGKIELQPCAKVIAKFLSFPVQFSLEFTVVCQLVLHGEGSYTLAGTNK